MAQDAVSWTCPYCGRPTTLTEHNLTAGLDYISLSVSEHGSDIGLTHSAVACPNPACKKLELTVRLVETKWNNHQHIVGKTIQRWRLLPESSAKPQPDYIPEALRDCYLEACRIASLSARASATLSRRCLQGMIRDFFQTPEMPNLYEEIEAIKDKVDPATWTAIHAVRELGNIGAHMKHDIDLIIEVDPDEAELLIRLIETLFKDWYVTTHDRAEQMTAVAKLAEDKKTPAPAAAEEAAPAVEKADGKTFLTS